MLGNDPHAEDATPDVMPQVTRNRDTFRAETQLTTCLHRVTVNAALAHRRKRANRQRREGGEPTEDELGSAGPVTPGRRWNVPPDEPVLAAEQTEMIEKAIQQLPEPFRDVYVLADVEGLPN